MQDQVSRPAVAKITRRVLIVSTHPYMPQLFGGAQMSADGLVSLFASSGIRSAVTAGLIKTGFTGFFSRLKIKAGAPAARDRVMGYPVYRSWDPISCLDKAIADFRPTSAIVMSMSGGPLARRLSSMAIPTSFYVHNLEDESFEDNPEQLPVDIIANSCFTARRLEERLGVKARVIPPVYYSGQYVVDRMAADSVLFVNPDERKGFATVLSIAAECPEIPFIIVEAWWTSRAHRRELRARISNLPNVSLRVSTNDMRGLYARTRVLLVPSVWEEAWGRVASEAQMSGIPVLAARVGGLVESVGSGGILIEPKTHSGIWSKELRRIWNDASAYHDLSQRALANASRSELDPTWQLAQLAESIEAARRKLGVRT